MTYQITVEFAPAYELVMSLDAYVVTSSHRSIDLGDTWAAETRRRLPPAFAAALTAGEPLDYRVLGLLIHQCPGPRDAAGFLDWLSRLSPGEVYERLSPLVVTAGIRMEMGALRDHLVTVLSQWHDAYFRHVEPALMDWLATDAGRVRQLSAGMPVELLVEEATRGYYLEPGPEVRKVLLVPQYHKRPITLHGQLGAGDWCFYYPAADFPQAAGQPGADLLRLTTALADDSRLRMIHALADGPRTFMELVAQSGLTKGTVHRHLWALRFAGLVRAHVQANHFALRPGAFERVSQELARFANQ